MRVWQLEPGEANRPVGVPFQVSILVASFLSGLHQGMYGIGSKLLTPLSPGRYELTKNLVS